MFRFPARFFDPKLLRLYCRGDSFSFKKKGESLVLEFCSEDEGGDWEDEEELSLSPFISLRTDLLIGDYRMLYLGWLYCVQAGEIGEGELEPPVPAGLKNLSGSLRCFVDLMRIDPKLVRAAAAVNVVNKGKVRHDKSLNVWSASLPVSERNRLLEKFIQGSDPRLRLELCKRFNASFLRCCDVSVLALLRKS